MANDLAALLRAVERWQELQHKQVSNQEFAAHLQEYRKAGLVVEEFPIAALHAAAHQHAEALRKWADDMESQCREVDLIPGGSFVSSGELRQWAAVMRAAADFLDGGQP